MEKAEELRRLRTSYCLPDTFVINDYCNWLPAHDKCNKNKGGEPLRETLQVMRMLEKLQREANKVREIAERVLMNAKKDKLLGVVMVAKENAVITKEDILLLFSDPDLPQDDDVQVLRKEFFLRVDSDLRKLRIRQEPRIATIGKLVAALEGKPPSKAEILYQEGDGEVFEFAGWLKSTLVHAKWDLPEPRPIGDTVSGSLSGFPTEFWKDRPAPHKLGAAVVGVTLVGNRKTVEQLGATHPNPIRVLLTALHASEIRAGVGQDDSTLPDGFIRIVIAPR